MEQELELQHQKELEKQYQDDVEETVIDTFFNEFKNNYKLF